MHDVDQHDVDVEQHVDVVSLKEGHNYQSISIVRHLPASASSESHNLILICNAARSLKKFLSLSRSKSVPSYTILL